MRRGGNVCSSETFRPRMCEFSLWSLEEMPPALLKSGGGRGEGCAQETGGKVGEKDVSGSGGKVGKKAVKQ